MAPYDPLGHHGVSFKVLSTMSSTSRRPATNASRQPLDPAAQVAVSHAEFLLAQARQIVNQLAGTNTLDPALCRQLTGLLDQAQIKPPPMVHHPAAGSKDSKKELKGKNKWAREVMADTPLLPTLVDKALSATAGPILSSSQREAIVDIVGISQARIADALTDPERHAAAQRWTQNTMRSAQEGLKGGLAGTGNNWDKWYMKQLVEADAQREKKSDSSATTTQRHIASVPSSSQASIFRDNPAAASVACLPSEQMADAVMGAVSRAGAATTTFSPWPGLVLTMSIVASGVSVDDVPDAFLEDLAPPPMRGAQGRSPPPPPSHMAPPPPRHTAAVSPPPPMSPSFPAIQPPPKSPSVAAHTSQPLPPIPPPQRPTPGPPGDVPPSLRPG